MRSVRHRILLLGSVLVTALWFRRRWPPEHSPRSHEPTGEVSALSLLIGCAVIMLATMSWLATQRWSEANERDAAARAMTSGDPQQGATLMTRYGCAGCHTIPGVPGADGQVGGPLTQMRKRVFIAGVMPNTASNLIGWIMEPQAHDPRSAMPVTGISSAEARDVAAWLYSR
jgi:mono/diheme cytochrome c family protein